jgi:Domain of unknown function (DUF4440)
MQMTRVAGLVLAVSLLFVLPARAAQAPSRDEGVTSELRALMTDLDAALAARDRAALERIYADEFLFVHALGGPIDKKTHIANALAAPPGPALPIPSFDGVLVYGDVAVFRRPEDGRFGTTIYAKKNGRWQIVQLQGTPVPSTRPVATVAPDVMRSYTGRYHQPENGLFITIGFEDDHLTLQVDGRDKLTLRADSDTKFLLPGGAGAVVFSKTADGMSYEVTRSNGSVVKGTRVK